jgi:phosphatidylserine/phosphatidylglycerophosphate/cardiolipin synthase-like enzyme
MPSAFSSLKCRSAVPALVADRPSAFDTLPTGYDRQRLPLTDVCSAAGSARFVYWGYRHTTPQVMRILIDAARRGWGETITNSRCPPTLMFFGLLGWILGKLKPLPLLLANGIRIFECKARHFTQNMVIDDAVASIGSYNIARGSAFHHTESNVVVYGGDFPAQVRQQFEIDFKDCRELSIDEVKAPLEWADPYRRRLNDRNFLINTTLLPDKVRRDLNVMLQESR